MNIDYQWISAWITAHADSLLAWLGAGLVVLILVRVQFVLLSRKAARAMSEAVATTVAACVPEIAAAARGGHATAMQEPVPGALAVEPAVPGQGDSGGQRAELLRQLGLQTIAAVDARLRRLGDLGNLRLPDEALTRVSVSGVADPLLVVAPQHTVQAVLEAQRVYDHHARELVAQRRAAQVADDACRAAGEELRQARQASAAITARFEQANGRDDQADLQRLLIQEYNALGTREASALERQTRLQQQAAVLATALQQAADAATQAYETAAIPVVARLRAAWGHDESSGWLTGRPENAAIGSRLPAGADGAAEPAAIRAAQ